MLYTSYFANISKLPPLTIPISIALKPLANWTGQQYTKVSPTHEILWAWKNGHDETLYRQAYKQNVLAKLNASNVVTDLESLFFNTLETWNMENLGNQMKQQNLHIWDSRFYHVALLCYEKPEDFCHRHLVAQWLTENGYQCTEYRNVQHANTKPQHKYSLSF